MKAVNPAVQLPFPAASTGSLSARDTLNVIRCDAVNIIRCDIQAAEYIAE